jgi:hypothetical protein
MVHKIITWALNNPLVVILLSLALATVGIYSFRNVNVEAYPDPAPAIIEVLPRAPGGIQAAKALAVRGALPNDSDRKDPEIPPEGDGHRDARPPGHSC